MRVYNKVITRLMILTGLLFSGASYSQISRYEQAVIWHEQNRHEQARPLLLAEAAAGNTKAMCLLGNLLSPSIFVRSEEGMAYFQRAAELGGYCGLFNMIGTHSISGLLGNTPQARTDYWHKKIEDQALKAAAAGDGEAMRMLFGLYGRQGKESKSLHWVKKAAEAGDLQAQYHLYSGYKEGKGWFLTESRRQAAIEKWRNIAASNYHPRAIANRYSIELRKKNYALALSILKKGEAIGDESALWSLAYFYARDHEGYQQAHFPNRLALSHGYCQILFKSNLLSPDDYCIHKLLPRLSEQEKAEGERFAEQWLATNQVRTYKTEIYFHPSPPVVVSDELLTTTELTEKQ